MTSKEIAQESVREYFDAIIVVPLEEEFEVVQSYFKHVKNLSNENQIRFEVSVEGGPLKILIAQQYRMGKTSTQDAVLSCLQNFDAGILVCVGIAGGLSTDLAIGDICYSGTIIDVLDNAKITENRSGKQDVKLSPTIYNTPRELVIAINIDRINPETKKEYIVWSERQGELAVKLIPGEFSGRAGKKERVGNPKAQMGAIACGLVSGSPEYNKKIKDIDRKVLAIETESGGLFSIADRYGIAAITIRGISDYAGTDKNKFEEETGNNARKIAAANAASFLHRQLSAPSLVSYLEKVSALRTKTSVQHPNEPQNVDNRIEKALLKQSEEIDVKLRDLAPGFAHLSKNFRLPVPRIRSFGRSGVPTASGSPSLNIRDIIQTSRIITLRVPRDYPDLSLSWVIASDLLTVQFAGDQQAIPCVVEARQLQRPRVGIEQLVDLDILSLSNLEEIKHVIIIDNFVFESKTRVDFLKEQIKAWPDAKFIVMTKSQVGDTLLNEFNNSMASYVSQLTDISFLEMSAFLQKNFAMPVPASEVVAIRLKEIFRKYDLPAHPSYFAGIPKNTLSTLLQANRRAELIELAVAGYLSFVVAEDPEPVSLSRTTRENFLADLAFEINVDLRNFSEAELTSFAENFAGRYDFNISPARFISSFIEKGILHVEAGQVKFTLPFMEAYLLAKRLTERNNDAAKYFSNFSEGFDFQTFAIYSEMGASTTIVGKIFHALDEISAELETRIEPEPILFGNSIAPIFLNGPNQRIQKRLQQAEEDVQNDRDQSHEKQRFLDMSDRILEDTASRTIQQPSAEAAEAGQEGRLEKKAQIIRTVAVALLGSGAERLEAEPKRELIKKVVRLSALIIDCWTRDVHGMNMQEIKNEMKDDAELIKEISETEKPKDVVSAKKLLEQVVDMLEYITLVQPFTTTMGHLCEEARDNVLAESISKAETNGDFEKLIQLIWLTDLDVSKGKKQLLELVKHLPKVRFLRSLISAHIITRVFWGHWRKEDRLALLNIANECVKGVGLEHNMAELKRTIDHLPGPGETIQ